MRFKTSFLILILFCLVMFSLTTVVADENIDSGLNNTDSDILSFDSTFSVENDQKDLKEESFEENDKECSDVLTSSENSILKAGNVGSFSDIQTAINRSQSGETIFLD